MSYIAAEDLSELSLPGTLRGLVQAQIDRLPETEQQLLSCASVIGPTVPDALLRSVLSNSLQTANISDYLSNLVRQTILTFDGSNYRFVHNIMHETVYQSLLSERRRQIHEQVGLAIEARAGEKTWADVEQLAHHFGAAENGPKAVPYLIQAGEKARQRLANESALTFFSTALRMLPKAPELADRESHIHKTIGDLYQHIGEYDYSLDHYHHALSNASDSDQRADYNRLIGQVWQRKGDIKQAQHWLDVGLDEVSKGHTEISDIVRGRIYADMSLLHMRNGDYPRAERWGIDAVAILEQTNESSELARSLNALGGAYYFQNQWRKASEQVERALEIQRQIGDQMGITQSLSNLGVLYTVDGQWKKAVDAFTQTIALSNEIGALEGTVSNAHNNIAFLYLQQGEVDLAETHLQKSLAIKQEIGTLLEVPETLNNLGLSRLMQGNYDEAETYLSESLTLGHKNNEQDALSEANRYMAELKLATGDTDTALQLCQQAVVLAHKATSKINEGAALRTLARIHLKREELPQARQAVETSLRVLKDLNHTHEMARTQSVIAEIALVEGDEATFHSAFKTAQATFEQLGARPDLDHLNMLKERIAAA
jgi:tetratricopeptide (TPR) repeat protein